MTSTVFTSGTVIVSPWLNDINAAIYTAIANSSGSPPTTTAQVVTNLSQAGGLATQNTAQTLTNKTLTNPTVTTGTFTSPALVTPAIGAATGTSLVLSGALNAVSIAANNDLTANNASIATFIAMSGGVSTIPSAGTIAPVKEISYISGAAAIATITPQSPILGTNGTIILIPAVGSTWTWTAAGNIAIAGTAVVGRALHMTYTAITDKWYPSYV